MEFFNKYKYPVIITIAIVALGWAYIFFMTEQESADLTKDRELQNYEARLKVIEGLRLKTSLFEGEIYRSLTDEFEEDVIEVRTGTKPNPFSLPF